MPPALPRRLSPVLLLPMLLAACGEPAIESGNAVNATLATNNDVDVIAVPEDSDTTAAGATNATVAELPTEAWIGRWTGPEGLFLDIQPGDRPGLYTLTIKDTLDRQGEYAGRADGAAIRFTRDGAERTIRTGTGEQTGFKWLADKTNCLIVVPGKEGYCR